MWIESNFKKCVTNPVNLRVRQVSVVLYDRFENVLICIIFTSLSAGHALNKSAKSNAN